MTIPTLEKQLEIQGHPPSEYWGKNLNLRVYFKCPDVYTKGWGGVPSASIKVCQFPPPHMQSHINVKPRPGAQKEQSSVELISKQRAKQQP